MLLIATFAHEHPYDRRKRCIKLETYDADTHQSFRRLSKAMDASLSCQHITTVSDVLLYIPLLHSG
jgi:hypothetical protein